MRQTIIRADPNNFYVSSAAAFYILYFFLCYKHRHHWRTSKYLKLFIKGLDMKTNMRKLSMAIAFITGISANSFAALPPKYLEIKDFKKCLQEKEIDSYRIVCMPKKKLAACPRASWKQLNALTENDKIPACGQK
ncbi:hypothetical protein ACFQNF_18010 [Iodobacter arcticus]|uniref:Uncharacterized protein n=1 Tax=Iodobacter arcticus TaxID=590593 RepID=A0ABW2R1E8_9NEIS